MKKPGIVHDIFFIVRVELLKQYMEISNMEVAYLLANFHKNSTSCSQKLYLLHRSNIECSVEYRISLIRENEGLQVYL